MRQYVSGNAMKLKDAQVAQYLGGNATGFQQPRNQTYRNLSETGD
jgi:hypothetical protein